MPASLKSPVVGEDLGDLPWLTSMWEPGGMVRSYHMVMVIKLMLCGISRSGSG